jgi:hypothetical protein
LVVFKCSGAGRRRWRREDESAVMVGGAKRRRFGPGAKRVAAWRVDTRQYDLHGDAHDEAKRQLFAIHQYVDDLARIAVV